MDMLESSRSSLSPNFSRQTDSMFFSQFDVTLPSNVPAGSYTLQAQSLDLAGVSRYSVLPRTSTITQVLTYV